jgi:hypothetical protein
MSERINRRDLQVTLNVEEGFLLELEQESIVVCDDTGCYPEESVEVIRLCRTLRDDLGVNLAGVEVVLHLLERIRAERGQFQDVIAQIKNRLSDK